MNLFLVLRESALVNELKSTIFLRSKLTQAHAKDFERARKCKLCRNLKLKWEDEGFPWNFQRLFDGFCDEIWEFFIRNRVWSFCWHFHIVWYKREEFTSWQCKFIQVVLNGWVRVAREYLVNKISAVWLSWFHWNHWRCWFSSFYRFKTFRNSIRN